MEELAQHPIQSATPPLGAPGPFLLCVCAPLGTSLQGLGTLPVLQLPVLQPPPPFSFFLASAPLLPQIPHPLLFCSVSTPSLRHLVENSFISWKLSLVQGILPLRKIHFSLRHLKRTVLLTPKEQTTNRGISASRDGPREISFRVGIAKMKPETVPRSVMHTIATGSLAK